MPDSCVCIRLSVCLAAEVEMVDGEGKSDSSPEREATAEDDSKDTDPCKKRKRKPYRPGERQENNQTHLHLYESVSRFNICLIQADAGNCMFMHDCTLYMIRKRHRASLLFINLIFFYIYIY